VEGFLKKHKEQQALGTAWKEIPPYPGLRVPKKHQGNVEAWSKVALNTPDPPREVVVPVVHLLHSDPL